MSGTMIDVRQPDLAGSLFEEHRKFLWRLLYRLTGHAADAEDLMQETFVRVLTNPPPDQEKDLRPWLVRVAVNLGRDLLRKRRRQVYKGPWLPSPIEEEPPSHEPVALAADPAAHYDLMESVSFAFLLALEALTPTQRAVLLLRDVFDYSVREAAQALDISETNVRAAHMRARRAMHDYDSSSRRKQPIDKVREALARFTQCVASGDTAGVEALLAADVVAYSDGGGEFHAAYVPVYGAAKIAKLFVTLQQRSDAATNVRFPLLNGLPGLLVEREAKEGYAPRYAFQVELDSEGRICRLYSILASRKLTGVNW